MNAIFLWWLTLGALIGFVAAWVWDWLWFRARRRAVSVDVDTQVATLAGERDKLAVELRACGERRVALEGQLSTAQGRVGELEAANARLQAELDAARAAGVTLGGAGTTLAAREVSGSDDMVVALREYNVALHDEIDATRLALARFSAGKGDPLIDIDGIGPVYQQKLYDAGVVTFGQVGSMHPERLRSIVAPNAVFELETDSWIAQARRMTSTPGRDPLIDINGIGPVYEQRLLNAGVTHFEQLGAMSEAEIRAIIKPEAWQNVDIAAWIAEARQLAGQVRAGTYRKGEY